SQLAPIVVVLILGVVTDYSVFTLTGMRARLVAGERRTTALRNASSRVVPLVIAAALTVAAGPGGVPLGPPPPPRTATPHNRGLDTGGARRIIARLISGRPAALLIAA